MTQMGDIKSHMKQRSLLGTKPKAIPSHYPETPSHSEIIAGFRVQCVEEVAQRIDVSPTSMAERIGVSRSTYHRKQKDNSLLSRHESDALARYSALFAQATDVFDGDGGAARRWLSCPQIGLGNAVPLDLAQTTVGYREVEKLLTRIDHGVYA